MITTTKGHLTATNKKHLHALLKAGLLEGKVNTIGYMLTSNDPPDYTGDVLSYTVKIGRKEQGQWRIYTCAFTIARKYIS